jgi:hypothetical protein
MDASMTRLFFGALIGSLGASVFVAAVIEEIPWLFGISSGLIFVGFGILVGTDKR